LSGPAAGRARSGRSIVENADQDRRSEGLDSSGGSRGGLEEGRETPKIRNTSHGILPQFVFSHLSHHLCTGILVPLLPLVRHDFELSYFRAGLLTSAFAIAYGFAQLPVAAFSERVGQRTVVVMGLLGMSLAGVAAGFTRDYNQLLASLVLMGLFGSSYHATSSALLSRSFTKQRRGQTLGLHIIGGNLSSMVAPFLAVFIASLSGSWRLAFAALALPALLAGLLLWATVPGREQAEIDGDADTSEDWLKWGGIIRAIGLPLGMIVLLSLITYSIHSFLPLYLMDKHGVSFEQAGILTGIMIGVGVVGSPLGGGLSDRVGREKVILVSVASAGPLLYLLTVAPIGFSFLGLLVVYGLIMSFRMPASESLIADYVPGSLRAIALATYFFFGQETSSVVTPLVGRVIDLHGMDPVFRALALLACAISVAALAKLR
jgi:FSR family fosmidomycin resistance protein-like MFS transporter